jgi:hypothetical protein
MGPGPGPGLAQPLDQQHQDRQGMSGAIDLARAQVTDQQLVLTEYLQWQKAVMIVVTVKETAFLFPVYGIVSGIKVQDQLFGGCFKRPDKLLDDNFVYVHSGLTIRPVLPTAQGREIVEVLIAQRQGIRPLAQQAQVVMVTARLAAWVIQDAYDGFLSREKPLPFSMYAIELQRIIRGFAFFFVNYSG